MRKESIELPQPQALKIPMSGYILRDGTTILEFRKKLTVCIENKEFVIELINAALSGKIVKAEVEFFFQDNLRAFTQLKKIGLVKNKEEKGQ